MEEVRRTTARRATVTRKRIHQAGLSLLLLLLLLLWLLLLVGQVLLMGVTSLLELVLLKRGHLSCYFYSISTASCFVTVLGDDDD